MTDEAKGQVAFSIGIEIVSSNISSIRWSVMLDGEYVGGIAVDPTGEFHVAMVDGTSTADSRWHFESLRAASAWAMEHVVSEEVGKGFRS